MFVARDQFGKTICARCGCVCEMLTKDHFVPLACKLDVNGEGNLVGLCRQCNLEKGCRVVLPQWYTYLRKEQQDRLWRYLRYARGFLELLCEDKETLEMIRKL